MPYIQCKDGRTYSRYDNSQYVKDCIECERKEYQLKYDSCTQDPACYAERLKSRHDFQVEISLVLTMFFIFFIIFFIMIYKLIKK